MQLDANLSFEERRKKVRELRLAAMRAVVLSQPHKVESEPMQVLSDRLPPKLANVLVRPRRREPPASPLEEQAPDRNLDAWNEEPSLTRLHAKLQSLSLKKKELEEEKKKRKNKATTPSAASQLEEFEEQAVKTVTRTSREDSEGSASRRVEIIHHHHHHYYHESPTKSNGIVHPDAPPIRKGPLHITTVKRNGVRHGSQPRRKSRVASVIMNEVERESSQTKVEPARLRPRMERTNSEDGEKGESNLHRRSSSQKIRGGFLHLAETMAEKDEDSNSEVESKEDSLGKTEKLEQMLEIATELERGPETSLVALGGKLNEARGIKAQQAKEGSKLPRFATTRELAPTRPSAEIENTPLSNKPSHVLQSRSRSVSHGAESAQRSVIEKEGWLYKLPGKSKWLGGGTAGPQSPWKRRYFKLTSNILFYMTHPSASRPKHMISLAKLEIETDLRKFEPSPTPHAMLVYEMNRRKDGFRICAASYKEILEWYKAIVNNAVICQNTRPSLPPKDRTPRTREQLREMHEKKLRDSMPKPDPPKPEQFYPDYVPPATHYDVLGVEPDAPPRDIKKRFYKLAAEFHPDKNPDVDPHEFALLSQAYNVLIDDQLREKYDLGEKVRKVFRRGFDCTLLMPTNFVYEGKRKRPTGFVPKKVTIFTDGELSRVFHQLASEESFEPLKPDLENSFELRFVEYVLHGVNDSIIRNNFLEPKISKQLDALSDELTEEEVKQLYRKIDTFIVLQGKKLPHAIFLQLDETRTCTEIINGLRIIRCESSVLFAQRLEKLQTEKGWD